MMPARTPAAPGRHGRTGQPDDLLPLGDWIRHHSLRSWPVLLFLLLICVPPIALVVLGANPSASTFDHVAWIFAGYFAVAWLLLLGVIIQPAHVTRPMLAVVVVVALATQVPLAVTLEAALHASNASLGPSIFTVGIPEELAKAIPVLVIALIYHRRHGLTPRDYLFLGAVSGLAFGAAEVVHYFTVNGLAEFYLTVRSAVPVIGHLVNTGHPAATSLFAALIGPVRYFVLDFVWRFITDPITHACWAGLTGYFIGLAATERYSWYKVAWIGLAAAAVLHGLNDWGRVNGHPLWIVVALVSGILFLGYAKVGSRGDPHFIEVPSVFLPHDTTAGHTPVPPGHTSVPPGHAPVPPDGAPGGAPATPPRSPAQHLTPGMVFRGRRGRPWWEH
jgi:RsiW-degrading membrane proteinase PrsW (M82 family)